MSDLRKQLALYVLDELEPAQRAELEEALRRDPDLRAEEAAWRRDLGELLAESAPEADLSGAELDALTDRLVSALPSRPEARGSDPAAEVVDISTSPRDVSPPGGAVPWASRLALAASLLAMVLAALAMFWLRSDNATERIAALEQRNSALEQELATVRQGLDRADAAIARVSSDLLTMSYPQSSPVVLAGLEAAPEAAGAAFYKPSAQQALFHAYGLPRAEPGTTYQLWYIPDGGSPVSAGVFEVDRNGEATVQVEQVPAATEIALWAVTVEPAGGSPQPTGTMVIRS